MRRLTVTDAARENIKAKLALSGGPGWGKTWTALRVARVLSPSGTILFIDTEHDSAKLYAPKPGQPPGPDEFVFKHASWGPPYNPAELTEAILHYAAHVDVLIVDSMSHFWQGEGGTLDIASGKFTGWKDARPVQRELMETIVRAPCHFIGCMRSKVEYAQEYDEKQKKQVVTRLGMADIQDNETAFEFTVTAELDIKHQLTVTKSRCRDLPLGTVFAPKHEVDMAATLLAWLSSDEAQQSTGPEVPTPSGPVAANGDGPAPGSFADRMRAAQQEGTELRRRLDNTQTSGAAGEPGEGDVAAPDTNHEGGEDHVTEQPAGQEREGTTQPAASEAGASRPPAAPADRPIKELLAAINLTPTAALRELRGLDESWHDLRSTRDLLALEGDRAESAITLLEQQTAGAFR
jgi:hypothetical protein